MNDKLFLSFLLCGLCTVTCLDISDRVYHFVNEKMNWTEAQQFCREHYTDLVSITSLEEMLLLPRPASNTADIWIGLNAEPSNQNWVESYPRPGECTVIRGDTKWRTQYCGSAIFYICKDDLGFHFREYSRNFGIAQTTCKVDFTDLATIRSAEDTQKIYSLMLPYLQNIANPTDFIVWINSRPEGWDWSDHISVSFTNWLSGYPLNFAYSSCAVLDPSNYWKDVNCGVKHAAFCYQKIRKHYTFVKTSMHSTVDVMDPEMHKLITQKIEELLQNELKGVTVK